jgi:hypothetical protein
MCSLFQFLFVCNTYELLASLVLLAFTAAARINAVAGVTAIAIVMIA